MNEQAPLRTSRYPYRAPTPRAADDPMRWMDDYDKIPIEEATQTFRADWTILRLPMVFGPGDRQRRFRWAIEPMRAGADTLEIPPQWADWLTTYGYVENIGAAIALASGHNKASRTILNVGDSEPVAHGEWIERFRRATGWQGAVRETNSPTNPIAKATHRLDLSIPLHISSRKLCGELSFAPPIDVHSCVERTVADEACRR
jgi:nucleoside-diphosphate-sugar epimerase